uniref:Pectinesterase n=1 Tax=Kalanchoe fedtschenkoi TaxID=63787 RepID=A0A7N0VCI0_KALFE
MGYQDSLFAEAFRQFYRDCDISGTVDFIFGSAAAVFPNCNLLLRRPVNDNVILANGRNHPEHDTGFSLHRFKITSTHEFYSVRHSYRKTPKTLYFVEYANYGAGASTSKRVQWSGYHVFGSREASESAIENFIAGDLWIPSTGVPFSAGLR